MPILDRLRQACSDFDFRVSKNFARITFDYAPSSKQISDFLWEEPASKEIGHGLQSTVTTIHDQI